jgi:hypothetical protein
MYGKLVTTCFKYHVYLYSSENITNLNALSGCRTSAMSHQAALPTLYRSII